MLKATEETVDLLPKKLREYLTEAQKYNTNDYTYTIVNDYFQGNQSPVIPELCWNYENFEKILSVKCLISESEDLENPIIYSYEKPTKDSGRCYPLNLLAGRKYFWQVQATLEDDTTIKSEILSFETTFGPRLLSIDGVENARDIGGWKTTDGKEIIQGLAFRSGKFYTADGNKNITDEGLKTLLSDLKIKTHIDLRWGTELSPDGNTVPSESLLSDDLNFLVASIGGDEAFFQKHKTNREAISLFADINNYPIIFHCAAGADRTGALAFILKAIAGVSENNLIADYEITPWRNRAGTEADHDFSAFIKKFKEYEGETIKEKAWNYCHNECGLSYMELSNIESILTGGKTYFDADSLTVRNAKFNQNVGFFIITDNDDNISKVLIDGKSVDFHFDGEFLELTATGKIGEIHLSSENKLYFEIGLN